jgi:hypothetical protein
MSKVYHIRESKPVVYTYEVYANSKAEALRKFNAHGDYEEIALDPGVGHASITVIEIGLAYQRCANCSEKYSPKNVGDYLCRTCENPKRKSKSK